MPIQPGKSLLHYSLVEKIGEGGMGVVWKASDTTLDRKVAIKILPAEFAQDVERVARFEREAKLLASLNHPNIAGIYGFHESTGQRFLAMELIPGEELAAHLKRGAMTVERSLEVCRQIAHALDAAHERGVIHRDLKPANVKITPEGKVKVLDFGLAKAFETRPGDSSLSQSPTMTSAGTRAGMILGTAAYMSPEQARGKVVDKRTDVWAFGCVLYECLTGRQAFGGDTVSDVLASILKTEPDWSALDGRCSARTVQLLRRCLEKDAGKRLRDIGDAGIELDELLAGDPTESARDGNSWRRASWLRLGVAGVAGILVGALFVSGWLLRRPEPRPAAVLRAAVTLAPGTQLDSDNRSIAFSPDGSVVAYTGRAGSGTSGIWLRRLDSLSSQHLSGTDGASYPFWSPDGNYLGFFADRKLRKIPATGGTAVTICDAVDGRGASWGANDLIVFSPDAFGALSKVAASGGTPTPATTEERADFTHRNPHFLPDGKRLLFYLGSSSNDHEDDGIYSLDIASGETSRVFSVRSEGMYIEPGYLAFIRDRNLMVQPMDPETLQLSGEPMPLAEDVQFNTFRFIGTFTFARNGLLLYRSGAVQAESQLTWFDLDGNELGKMGESALFWLNLDIAPNGRQAIANVRRSDGQSDLWIYDLERGLGSPFTFGGDAALIPHWSPDGSQVAFTNGAGQILVKAADGLTQARTVYDPSTTGFALGWTPDGNQLLLYFQSQDRAGELTLLEVDGDGEPLPVHSSPANETSGSFSPDGKFLALISDASGRAELYVYSHPEGGGKWQISTSGATGFQWLPDGSGLIYSTPEQSLMRVLIATSATGLRIGAAEELFGGRFAELSATGWTLAPDGERLLVSVPLGNEAAPVLTLVSNWAEELR